MKSVDDITTVVFKGKITMELNQKGGADFSEVTPIGLMKGDAIKLFDNACENEDIMFYFIDDVRRGFPASRTEAQEIIDNVRPVFKEAC